MPLRNEEVLPAIIVVIEEVRAPTRKSESRAAQARLVGRIPEAAVAVVVKEVIPLVGKICDDNIRATVIVEIAEVGAHPGERFAVLIVGNACGQANFGKRSVAIIVIQDVGAALKIVRVTVRA